jgi:hypothetical protein
VLIGSNAKRGTRRAAPAGCSIEGETLEGETMEYPFFDYLKGRLGEEYALRLAIRMLKEDLARITAQLERYEAQLEIAEARRMTHIGMKDQMLDCVLVRAEAVSH